MLHAWVMAVTQLDLMENGLSSSPTIPSLQALLRLAHSPAVEDQITAAVELSKLVEKTSFPAVSFGPLAHALCRLVPNPNRTTAAYAARAVKVLLLDDALRPQAVAAGIPRAVVEAIKRWEEEIPCLRELMGALQTLCWDRNTVKSVVDAGAVDCLVEYLDSSDAELQLLSMATAANILVFADTLFLTNEHCIDAFHDSVEAMLNGACSQEKAIRCYSVAALANASAHPVLAGRIKELGGVEVLRAAEQQNRATLTLGLRLADCAAVAVARLTATSVDHSIALRKFSFKWGRKSVVELMFDSSAHRFRLGVCFIVWLGALFLLFRPLLVTT